jgi:hypothetical protein
MPGPILTTASLVTCAHGIPAKLATTNATTSAAARALIESDVHDVLPGCPFTVGTKYSPCKTIEWSEGASKVTIGGTKVLVSSSKGACKSAEGAFQGFALVAATQFKATAK